jgi:hypothetical protein
VLSTGKQNYTPSINAILNPYHDYSYSKKL